MKYLINDDWLFVDYAIDFNSDYNCYKNIKTLSRLGDIDALVVNHPWRTLSLPHDFCVEKSFDEAHAPMLGFKKAGCATYMRFFDLPDIKDGESVILEFEGIMGKSDIYFNSTHVKHVRSGYTGFLVDVTDYVVNGVRNTLCVCVDGNGYEGWWYEGAGIYRNAYIHIKKATSFAPLSVFFKPKKEKGETWKLITHARVRNFTENNKKAILTLSLSKDGEEVKTQKKTVKLPYGETEIEFSLSISSPVLWSPENPFLYSASLSLSSDGEICDTQTEKIGFRYFDLDSEKGLYLNGTPYKIKGIVCHQDHAGVGVALTEDVLRYRVKILKEMGCNGYRSAHHSATPALLRICDETGMLVLDENRHFDTSEDTEKEVASLVLYARNHPSVYCYSLFNEEPVQANCIGARIARRLKNTVLALDDSRFVSGAMHTDILTDGSAADEFALVGANYQMHLFDEFKKKNPEKNIMATENACVFATRGIYETDKEKHFFSEYGDEVASWGMSLEDTWKIVAERDFVISAFMWCGFDYRGEPCPFYKLPSNSTHWGLTDTCGFPKSTYYMLQCCYKDSAVLHIIKDYKKTDCGYCLTIISNCDTVEVKADEKTYKATSSAQYRFAVTLPEIPKTASVFARKGSETIEEVYTLPSEEKCLRLSHFGNIINAEMTDKEGNLILDDSEISFSVDGGYITGVGNGNPTSEEPDYAEKRKLFSGKCQMHLRPTSEKVTVYAVSEKGEKAEISYSAELCNDATIPAVYELYASSMMMYRNEYEGSLSDFSFDSRDMNNYSVANSSDAYIDGRHIYALRLNIDGSKWKLLFKGVKSPVTVYEKGILTTLTEDGEILPLGDDVILIENTCRDGVGGFDIPLKISKK